MVVAIRSLNTARGLEPLLDPLTWVFALGLIAVVTLSPFGAVLADEVVFEEADASHDRIQDDLFALPIEDLVAMQVTSVAGVEQDWFETASAITVITGDQLLRSGFTNIADALRMVPGMFVGQVDSRQWAITSRGFAGLFSNSLQVVIDGRVVYNELFGGVYWDVQEMLLENVDRIEVIRGPGATLWGANAVNGVVNVITKSTEDTLGTYVGGGAGNEERGFAEGRHGGTFGESGSYRIWGRFVDRDSTQREVDGSQTRDNWNLGIGGIQVEQSFDNGIHFMLQGQGHSTDRLGQSVPDVGGVVRGDGSSDGGHVLARVSQSMDSSSSWTAQAYFDIEDRDTIDGFNDRRKTYDVSVRHQVVLWDSNEVLWGAGYRHRHQQTSSSNVLRLDPSHRSTNLATAFVQDTITLVDERVFLMLGSKFEYNDFTGFEFQPGGRVWWTPTERTTLWAAVSRPVRIPTLIEEDLIVRTGPTTTLRGDRNLDAETLVAYELGGRRRLAEGLIVDVAAFFNQHDELIRRAPDLNGDEIFQNVGSARGYGVEVSVIWQPLARLRFDGSYTFYELDSGSDLTKVSKQGSPRHQFQIRSEFNLTKRIGADVTVYFVDEIRRFDIDAYVRLDVGLHWKPYDWIELAVFGQNLVGPHAEYFQPIRVDVQTEIERSFYGRVKLRF